LVVAKLAIVLASLVSALFTVVLGRAILPRPGE
jgi:hypothetical protein